MKHLLLLLSLPGMTGLMAQHAGDRTAYAGHGPAHATTPYEEDAPGLSGPELVSFEARSAGSEGVRVSWTTFEERADDHYRVERSADLLSWHPANGAVTTTAAQDGYTSYRTTDPAPFNGVSYYRLVLVEEQGERELSDLFSVRHDTGHDLLIHEGHAPGHFVVLASGTIDDMRLLNNRGQFVPMDLYMDGDRARVDAGLLAPGTYYVHAVVNGRPAMRPVFIGNGGTIGG